MKYDLPTIYDLNELETLCESYSKISGIGTTITDTEGHIYVKAGWKKFCSKYHINKDIIEKNCFEKETMFSEEFKEKTDLNICKCKNGFLYAITPIIVKEDHVGNFLIGQFLSTEPDIEYFTNQAILNGFNEKEYIEALKNVPVLSEEQIKNLISFLVKLVKVIGNIGVKRIDFIENSKRLKDANEIARKLSTLISNLSGMVYRCNNDENWTMEYISNGSYGLCGYFPEDLIYNKKIAYGDLITPEHQQLVWEGVQNGIVNKKAFNLTYKIKCADGSKKWVYERGQGIFENDTLIAIEGIITDITKQKETEEALIKAKVKAEESDRLKSAFLANMSHEIRTPMNAIVGFAGILKDSVKDNEKLSRYIDIIVNSSDHLLNLINDIVDISKIEAGEIKISESNLDINKLLRELYNFFHSHLIAKKKYGVYLKMDIPYQEFFLLTDEIRLRQILINLIGNAFKFTDNGEIEFGYKLKENKVEFFVRDTGIGIPKEKQKVIFERFRQAAESSQKFYGGTGLGLSIAKACTELLNGKIWLESIPNFGTTFYFDIKYTPGQKQKKENENVIAKYEFNNELILIAEDDEYNFEYLKTVLTKYNLRIERSKTGKEAIKKALEYDELKLILMDIQMPDLTGEEATVEIKKHKPNLPIIAQTAYAMNSDKERYLKIGCNSFIPKPIKEDELIKLIKNYL